MKSKCFYEFLLQIQREVNMKGDVLHFQTVGGKMPNAILILTTGFISLIEHHNKSKEPRCLW